MSSWFASITSRIPATLQKRIAKFVVKRTLGRFLQHELVLDQLDVSLASGMLELKQLAVNVDAVNEFLHDSPVTAVSGVLESVTLVIPWTKLGVEPCRVELRGAQVVVVPDVTWLGHAKAAGQASAARMEDTMSASMHLAEEFLRKGGAATPATAKQRDLTRSVLFERATGAEAAKVVPASSADNAASDMDGLSLLAGLIERILETLVVTATNTTVRILVAEQLSRAARLRESAEYAMLDVCMDRLEFTDTKLHDAGDTEQTLGLHKIVTVRGASVRHQVFKSPGSVQQVVRSLPPVAPLNQAIAVLSSDEHDECVIRISQDAPATAKLTLALDCRIESALAAISPAAYKTLQALVSHFQSDSREADQDTSDDDDSSGFSSDSGSALSDLDEETQTQLSQLLASHIQAKRPVQNTSARSAAASMLAESSMPFYSTVSSFDADVTSQMSLSVQRLTLYSSHAPIDLSAIIRGSCTNVEHVRLACSQIAVVQQRHSPDKQQPSLTVDCSVQTLTVYARLHANAPEAVLAAFADDQASAHCIAASRGNQPADAFQRISTLLASVSTPAKPAFDLRYTRFLSSVEEDADEEEDSGSDDDGRPNTECVVNALPLHVCSSPQTLAALQQFFVPFSASGDASTGTNAASPELAGRSEMLDVVARWPSLAVWHLSDDQSVLLHADIQDARLRTVPDPSCTLSLAMEAASAIINMRTSDGHTELVRLHGNELTPTVTVQIRLRNADPAASKQPSAPVLKVHAQESLTSADYRQHQQSLQSYLDGRDARSAFALTVVVPVLEMHVTRERLGTLAMLQSTAPNKQPSDRATFLFAKLQIDRAIVYLHADATRHLVLKADKAVAMYASPIKRGIDVGDVLLRVGGVHLSDGSAKAPYLAPVFPILRGEDSCVVATLQPVRGQQRAKAHLTIQHMQLLVEQKPTWHKLLADLFATDDDVTANEFLISLNLNDCCLRPELKPLDPAAILHLKDFQVQGSVGTGGSGTTLNVMGSGNLLIAKSEPPQIQQPTSHTNTVAHYVVQIMNQRILLNTCADTYPLLTSLVAALSPKPDRKRSEATRTVQTVLEPIDMTQSRMLGLAALDEGAFTNRQKPKYFDLTDLTVSLVDDFDTLASDIDSPDLSPDFALPSVTSEEMVSVSDAVGLEIVEDHFAAAEATAAASSSPRTSVVRVRCKNISVTWKLFDGMDWASTSDEARSGESKIDFLFSNVEIEYDQFADSADTASCLMLAVQQFEIIDNVDTSTWRKFLSHSRRDYQPHLPFMRIDASGVRLPGQTAVEYRLKAQLQPVKLNIDQETLDTLVNFFSSPTEQQRTEEPPSDVFIQRCEVYPITLRVDYKPKHVNYSQLKQGNFVEMLNFFNLEGAEMNLRHLIVTGVRGWPKLWESILDGWLPHVANTQVQNIVSGVGPIRSFRNIASGVADLVLLPVQQYKKDGRLIKGLRKGAQNFVTTTAVEALNLGTKLAVGTHGVLEQADNLLSGDRSQELAEASVSRYADQPANVKEGLELAYKSLSRNVTEAAKVIAMPMEVFERDGSGDGVRAVIKAVPIAILRPVIGATEAVSKTLMGLRNTMDPAMKQESQDKYK
ncbi:autophagy- protein 2 [Sorochytrium milnesiophthora]